MSVVVKIATTFDDRGVAAAQRRLARFGSAAKGFAGSTAADLVHLGATMQRVGGQVSRVGDTLSTRFTLPVVAAFGYATKAAIDEQKEMALLESALRKNTGATDEQVAAVERWITATQNATGVADGELRPALATLLTVTKDTAKAQELMRVALDIAAAKSKPVEQVATALMKAYSGNIGALGRLGVATRDAEGKTLTFEQAMQQAQATFGGAAAKAADTTAGRLNILKARLQDTAEEVGTGLIPVVEQGASVVSSLAERFNALPAPAKSAAVKAALVGAALGPMLSIGGRVITLAGGITKAVGNIGIAFGENAKAAPRYARAIAAGARGVGRLTAAIGQGVAWLARQATALTVSTARAVAHAAGVVAARAAQLAAAAASKAWAAAQWLLNVALSANPIGLVVAAIAGLAVVLVIAWKKSETFRKIVTGAWEAIKRAALRIFGAITAFFRRWGPLILRVLIGPIGNLVLYIVKHWDQIKTAAAEKFGAVVQFARELPDKIKRAVGDLGRLLYDAGADLLRGLWSGIQSVAGWLKDKLVGFFNDLVPGWAKKALGISSPSRVFAEIGRAVAAGMALGITANAAAVRKAVAALVSTTSAGGGLSLALAGAGAPAGREVVRETVVRESRLATASAPTYVSVYLDSEPIAARVEVRQGKRARRSARTTGAWT